MADDDLLRLARTAAADAMMEIRGRKSQNPGDFINSDEAARAHYMGGGYDNEPSVRAALIALRAYTTTPKANS